MGSLIFSILLGSYYKHDKRINTVEVLRKLANLTPELDMGYYELCSMKRLCLKRNGRKTIVFYYVKGIQTNNSFFVLTAEDFVTPAILQPKLSL